MKALISTLDSIANKLQASGLVRLASQVDAVSNDIERRAEDLMTFKISLEKEGEADLLRIGFGAPAQNDRIIKDVAVLIDDLAGTSLKGGKLLKVNGPASLPVAMHLAHKVGHLYGAVACFDPKMNKYIVSISHDPEFALGDAID